MLNQQIHNEKMNKNINEAVIEAIKERLYHRMVILLEEADKNYHDENDNTFLHWAAYSNELDALNFLIRKDVDVHVFNKGGFTPLHMAAAKGNTAIIKALLDTQKIPVDAKREAGTSLYRAIINREEDAARLLIAYGADINWISPEGKTLESMLKDPPAKILFNKLKGSSNPPITYSLNEMKKQKPAAEEPSKKRFSLYP